MKRIVAWINKHTVISILLLVVVLICIPILVEVGYRIIPGDSRISADALLTYIGAIVGALIMIISILVSIHISREEMENADIARFENHRQDIKPVLFLRAFVKQNKVEIEIECQKNVATSIYFGANVMVPVLREGNKKKIEMDIVKLEDTLCCKDKYGELYTLNKERIPEVIELVYSDSEGNVITQKVRWVAGNEGVYEKNEAEYA